ncbi:hypothetical protein LEP1GSC029_0851 [Leptospira interrogans str. 2002000626]|uniref:Uncharacterized protein n=1 Tax=Leptospira interrogans str. 2002000626 TaxID=996803 RepID=A0A829D2I9_LEPIR|nr:hypothetical protein LEP1GSC029_0851 [Leptospira interrogans str. 2002000626]
MDKTRLYSEYSGIPEDDQRLIYASFLVLALASFFTAHLLTRNMLWKILGSEPMVKMESNEEKEKIYEVLLEQDFVDKNVKDEYKALSNVDAAGAGGITKNKGFILRVLFENLLWEVLREDLLKLKNRKPKKRTMKKFLK